MRLLHGTEDVTFHGGSSQPSPLTSAVQLSLVASSPAKYRLEVDKLPLSTNISSA